jgi:hypothetical protein
MFCILEGNVDCVICFYDKRQKDLKTERQKDRKTERQKDRKTERQKDGNTDRQTERQKV